MRLVVSGSLEAREAERMDRLAPPDKPQDHERLLGILEHAFGLRHDDPDRGEAIAREQLALAEAAGDRHAAAAAAVVLVYCSPIEDNADEMLSRLHESLKVLEEVGDRPFLVRAADLLSTILEGSGDYPAALQLAEQVVKISREIGDRLFEGYGLSSLAGVLTAAGDLEAAERKLLAGLEIAAAIGSPRLEARLRLRLGRVACERGDLETGIASFERTRQLAQETSSAFTEVDALTELGRTFERLGRLEEAEAHYEEALRLSDEDVRRVIGPRTRLGLGRLYLTTGRVELARDVLVDLRELARSFYMLPVQAEAARSLVETYERLGDPARALEEMKRYVDLKEQLMDGATQRAVKAFQARMEIESAKKDAEIHRLKYVELQAMQTQLVEAERMAVVGHLTAGLAHEMNTPLGVVRSNLVTAERAVARIREVLPSPVPDRLKRAIVALVALHETSAAAVERLEGLVRSLRRFTRLDEAEYQKVDVNEGLEATLEVVRATVPAGVALERSLAPVPSIWGFPGSLNQAFLTLIVNAVEAVGEGGTVRIESLNATERGEIEVRIEDDGPGIPEAIQPRLFDLELQQDGRRTRFRVGLATVRSIVLRHHGEIRFETGSAWGTRFILRFPVAEGPAPDPARRGASGRHERAASGVAS